MGSVSGAESLYRRTVLAFAQIAGLRTKRIMNAVKAIFHALSVRCMVSVIGAGKIRLFPVESCAKHVMNRV